MVPYSNFSCVEEINDVSQSTELHFMHYYPILQCFIQPWSKHCPVINIINIITLNMPENETPVHITNEKQNKFLILPSQKL